MITYVKLRSECYVALQRESYGELRMISYGELRSFCYGELLKNPYVTLHNIYYGVLHNISSVALHNKSYVTKKFTEFSENLKKFNYSLYSDNGGLIYGNGSGGTDVWGRGSYTSTHPHLHVYPIPPNLSKYPHIPPNILISLHQLSHVCPTFIYLHISRYFDTSD